MITSKSFFSIITFCLVLLSVSHLNCQTLDDINSLSTEELNSFVTKARENGYTPEQLRALAASKGLSTSEINDIVGRVNGTEQKSQIINDNLNIDNTPGTGLIPNPALTVTKSTLFGYDFFNNPNISFQPNLNLATPANYQLGPGDGLVISLWGAAENTYDLEVNRNGGIKIPNIGQVLISGLTLEEAREKIKSKLLNVYRGISAPNNSPYKIFTDISLSRIRTVQVNIIGEIQVPGTYALSALSTVLNALYASGGPTKQGTFREIKLIRDGKEISTFDVYDYLINGSQKGNLTIRDQDVIIVGTYLSKINITGKVKRPGVYELFPDENFSHLLNYVSGFKSDAYKDVIKLERINGDRKQLKEMSYESFEKEKLIDGDAIRVGGIINEIENSVTIDGAVYRPGNYEFVPGMTIKQLIEKASGLKKTAFLKRVLISSKIENKTVNTATYSLEEIMKGNVNVVLENNDVVRVFQNSAFNEQGSISISGAVNNPTDIPFVEGITLEELLLFANGYAKEANTAIIDVTREAIDDDYTTINTSFTISAENSLDISTNTPFVFKPNDRIKVRYLKGSREKLTVFIEGEALYPGSYDATFKNERILDLIEKAGGLSPYAFEQGATLVRQNPFYNDKAQNITLRDFKLDTANAENKNLILNNNKEFRVGIDLHKIIKEGDQSKQNMILKDGDRLVIPSIKQTIKVDGQVLLPSLIRYEKSLNFKEYINKSGGFNNHAKKNKAYVIHPNGDIASTKRFLFFKNYPKVRPGSLIVIPAKLDLSLIHI